MIKGLTSALVVVAIMLVLLAIETWRDAARLANGIMDRFAAGLILLLALLMFALAFGVSGISARDLGQWEAQDPAIAEWYRSLMQPDVPEASCCGEADAYFCDDIHVKGDKDFCAITDDRPDAPRGRPHIEIGTAIEIPPNKLKWDRGNPTGHGVVFLSRAGYVFCYVQPGGA